MKDEQLERGGRVGTKSMAVHVYCARLQSPVQCGQGSDSLSVLVLVNEAVPSGVPK